MADFFKYLWHCISGAISYLCGYAPDNYSWKDFGVAFSILILVLVIEILILLKVRVFRKRKSQNNDSSNDNNELNS